MPNNKPSNIENNDIDYKKIILTLWKEKILIILVTLSFIVVAYIYGLF